MGILSGFASQSFSFSARNSVGVLSTSPDGLFSALPSAAAARGLQVAARANGRADQDKQYQNQLNELELKARAARREANNLNRVTGRIDRAEKTIEKGIERLNEIKTIIADMRRQAVTAQDPSVDAEARRNFAERFDQFLGKLNLRVRTGGFIGVNLIGTSVRDDFEPDELTYQTKPDSPVRVNVNGIYSQSDFFITDAGGDNWYPDLYGSLVEKFPNPDDTDAEVVKNTDTVVFDDSTGDLSLTRDGEASPYLEGTVTRKGLGILFSFLYNDFEDDASIDRAIEDVDAASSKIRFNIGFLEGELAKVRAAKTLVEGKIESRNEFAAGVEAEAFGLERRAQLEARREQILFNSTLQNTIGFNNQGGVLALSQPSLFSFTV